jgi:hypothetical protein
MVVLINPRVPVRRTLDVEIFTVESFVALNPDEVAANHEVPSHQFRSADARF